MVDIDVLASVGAPPLDTQLQFFFPETSFSLDSVEPYFDFHWRLVLKTCSVGIYCQPFWTDS